jgi:hypothetical protein
MLRLEFRRCASAKRRSRKVEPSGSGVNLLKSGMHHRRGYQQPKHWKHDHGPPLPKSTSLDQSTRLASRTSTSNGNPSKTASENLLDDQAPSLGGGRVETESVLEFESRLPREWQTDDV